MKKCVARVMGKFTAIWGLAVVSVCVLGSVQVYGHCQVPCGIYNDAARVSQMMEDLRTIEKAVNQIQQLSVKEGALAQQQLVRWVTNKEKHAQNIIETIADYYLTQRVKPSQEDYGKRLERHHAVILAAMNAKQKVNVVVVEELRGAIEALAEYYPHSH